MLYFMKLQGVAEKIVQSLCTTILQPYVMNRVMQFSAKCSEINCLHDKGQYLSMTIKYSLFCSCQVNFENKIKSKIRTKSAFQN